MNTMFITTHEKKQTMHVFKLCLLWCIIFFGFLIFPYITTTSSYRFILLVVEHFALQYTINVLFPTWEGHFIVCLFCLATDLLICLPSFFNAWQNLISFHFCILLLEQTICKILYNCIFLATISCNGIVFSP